MSTVEGAGACSHAITVHVCMCVCVRHQEHESEQMVQELLAQHHSSVGLDAKGRLRQASQLQEGSTQRVLLVLIAEHLVHRGKQCPLLVNEAPVDR